MVITRKQSETLRRKYIQGDLYLKGFSFLEFRRTVQPTFGCDGAIAVPWCGMWLCIEKDGYCHT